MEKKLQKLMEETWALSDQIEDLKTQLKRIYGSLAVARHKIVKEKYHGSKRTR